MTPDTERPLTLAQLAGANRRPRTGLILGAISAVALIAVAIVVAAFLIGGQGRRPSPQAQQPAADSSPVVSGIARPDATCVQTDGTDHQDYWNGNGWWAGRVDGDEKQMPALSVLSMKLQGHQINSVWICAPRSNG